MGLIVADLDLEADALAADDLLEDLAEPCLCEHLAGDHGPDGCRACACGARCWDGLTTEDLEDDEQLEADVARAVAFLNAASARRRKLDDERRDREATRAATAPAIKPRMVNRRNPKAPPVEPKAPGHHDEARHRPQ